MSSRPAIAADTDTRTSPEDRSFIMFAAAAIALAVLAGFFLLPRLAHTKKLDAKPAPEFVLPVVHNGDPGSRLALADLKGKPVLIDFWATWCGPCAMQTPIVDRLAKRYEGKVNVVGIDVADDDPNVARRYAEQKQLSYPVVVDDKGLTQREYGVTKLPSLIIIDKDGKVIHQTSGLVDEATLDRMLREAM
ncbi:MAG TPA: TlpA disulfide reductase family protein [Polyangiaceae bacterium]|nr:TlpA disulfide reductase family protein [Polyangiaceae bacterium]